MINSYETLFYTSMIIVPGAIVKIIYNCCFPIRKHSENKENIIYLAFGLFNYAISSLLFEISIIQFSNKKIAFILDSCFSIIIIGIIIYIFSKVIKKESVEKFFNRNIIDLYPSAWDYMFRGNSSRILEITLKSGKIIYGAYGNNSFASVKYYDNDIYLERTYSINNEGVLVRDDDSDGVYISGTEIEKIIELKKGNNNENK